MTEFECSWLLLRPFVSSVHQAPVGFLKITTTPRTTHLSLLQTRHLPRPPLLITCSSVRIVLLLAAAVRDKGSGFVILTSFWPTAVIILLCILCHRRIFYAWVTMCPPMTIPGTCTDLSKCPGEETSKPVDLLSSPQYSDERGSDSERIPRKL